jgi:hypothetical protein
MPYTPDYAAHGSGRAMTEMKPLPKYICHKEVEALKIKEVFHVGNGVYALRFVDEDYPPLNVPNSWIDRFGPTPGSYWVKYKDGYTSVSPAKAFEEGYVRQSADAQFGPREG